MPVLSVSVCQSAAAAAANDDDVDDDKVANDTVTVWLMFERYHEC